MKDLSGVPGPQIVEDFVSSLRRGMQGGDSDGSIASLPWVGEPTLYIVTPLNKGHFGTNINCPCREVVLFSEVKHVLEL